MSLVKPFTQCIARPAEGPRPAQMLTEHLERVACLWSSSLKPAADPTLKQLVFLAGLLHDAGKARQSWQEYVLKGKRGRGPFHSPFGAAVFDYASSLLLSGQRVSVELAFFRAQLVEAIADHHGAISDVGSSAPWDTGAFSPDQVDEVDVPGLWAFINRYFPSLSLDLDEFKEFLDDASRWTAFSVRVVPSLRFDLERDMNRSAKMNLKMAHAGLVCADRFDACGLQNDVFLEPDEAQRTLRSLEEYTQQLAAKSSAEGDAAILTKARSVSREEALVTFRKNSNSSMFTLLLPTGYGKTLTALSVALEACARGLCKKIVYVAPYIAILSQAARDIQRATGLDVMTHHHMTVVERDLSEPSDFVILESWHSAVVATTFNQLFEALFPRRSQETLRLGGLKNAFVIIDEPQVLDASVWKVFLKLLEAACSELGCKVLFATATMPDTGNVLSTNLVDLVAKKEPVVERYAILVLKDTFDQDTLVDRVQNLVRDNKSTLAVVMNTVRDSALLYLKLRDLMGGEGDLEYVSGGLIPIHKAQVIDRVRRKIDSGKDRARSLIVVSTQVLEAGVNLSFNTIYRELPIIPSVVQVAGRANRHACDSSLASVFVFKFIRADGNEPRKYVYKNSIWREITDTLLLEPSRFAERDTASLLESFYRECEARTPNTGLLSRLHEAATGEWTILSGLEPFGSEYSRVSVFVPWNGELDAHIEKLMKQFGIAQTGEIYERYIDREFMSSLSFAERKKFMALLQQFCVSVSEKVARSIAAPSRDVCIWPLTDGSEYDPDTGLSTIGENSEYEFL